MSLALEKKLPLILLFACLMLAAIGFLSYRNSASLKQAVEWQKRAQEVLLKLDNTLVAAVDIETGGRGFILSGNDAYLDSYRNGKQKAAEDLAALERLLSDNPKQLENLAQLRRLVDERIAITENYVVVRRAEGLLGGVNEFSAGRGRAVMTNLRGTVDRMREEENSLLKLREGNLQTTLDNNFWMMIMGALAGTLSLGLANFIVIFEIKKRREAETALTAANQGLEERVEERTAELERANEELREVAAERKQLLTREKKARREAELANRLRDEFMATISHELRTPLNAVIGWARILKSGRADEAQQVKAVETIIKNAEVQNRLIEDLLDVGRIVSGKLALEREDVRPAEIVAASIETVKPAADEKSIELSFETDESSRETLISADPQRLQQVVWNLLSNAIKFTPEGGAVKVSLECRDGFAALKVADNGAGIKPEFLPFVFERFRQDAATIKQSGGLGLGLAIVRHLVEMHGGEAGVESEGENCGATFTVTFPLHENGKNPSEQKSNEESSNFETTGV